MQKKKSHAVKHFLLNLLRRWLWVQEHEVWAIVWAFCYFFCLLGAYYILRPLRDEMGIMGGVENLQWMFTGTFVTMLAVVPVFGYVTRRYGRRKFLPYVYLFFVGNILVFFILFSIGFSTPVMARIFFIWLSVFNLFVVSVFWSFMADIFSNEQSKRLFGIIAAGGSAGAITGPSITAVLAKPLGTVNLLLVSAGFLLLATFFIRKLLVWSGRPRTSNQSGMNEQRSEMPLGGSILAGVQAVFRSRFLMGISAFVILYTMVSTFLYFEQANIVEDTMEKAATRTTYFAGVDLITNILAISSQLFLTSRLIRRFELAIVLACIPALVMLGFVGLSLMTVLPVLVVVRVIHRAGHFSLLRPGREMLFTVTSREERYKAKNFIDTAVYRGGDALTGWAFAGLQSLGLGLSAIAFIAVPVAGLWMITGFTLGKKQHRLKEKMEEKAVAFLSSKTSVSEK